MTTITIHAPDDLAPNQDKEREYDVCFVLERPSRSPRPGSAKFHVFAVWDEKGRQIIGAEFDLVATHAIDCYYEKMLRAVWRN